MGYLRVISVLCLCVSLFHAYAQEDTPPPQPACAVVQVELLRLTDTGQWDFFTSKLNEFFFDVYASEARTLGNGSTSQLITPDPVPVYHSDREDGKYNQSAFIPVTEDSSITVSWKENDSITGVLSRSDADAVGQYTLAARDIRDAEERILIRSVRGSRSAGKYPLAKFKFTCHSENIHQVTASRFASFQEEFARIFDEDLDPEDDLQAALQEKLDHGLSLISNEYGIELKAIIADFKFEDITNIDELVSRLVALERVKEGNSALLTAFFDDLRSLSVWADGDFGPLFSDSVRSFDIGQIHLNMFHQVTETPAEETAEGDKDPTLSQDSVLTFDLRGNLLSFVNKTVNDKLATYPFGSMFQKNYASVQDAFNHLTSLNVLSNKPGFSNYMNAANDTFHIYPVEEGQLRIPTAVFGEKYIALDTQTVGTVANAEGMSYAQKGILFMFRLAFSEELGLSVTDIIDQYAKQIAELLKKLPFDFSINPGG